MKSRGRYLALMVWMTIALGAAAYAQMPGMGGGTTSFTGFQGHNMNFDLILPQVVVGQHYSTSILLLNMGNAQVMNWVPAQNLTTTGKLYFYHQDGTPLQVSVNNGAPSAEMAFSLGSSKSISYQLSASGSDTPGWALIDVDEPSSGAGWGMMDGATITRGMRLMADVFYTYTGEDQPSSRVGVVPSMYEMGRFATSRISVLSNSNMYTGVAIVNTSANAITVNLRLEDSSGNILSTIPLTLNAGSQVARFIHELFASVLTPNFQGFLEVDSGSDGIVAMGLLLSQGILTSVPMEHYGQITMMP